MKKGWQEVVVSVGYAIAVVEIALLLFFLPTSPLFLQQLNNDFWDNFQRSDLPRPSNQIAIVGWDYRATYWFATHGGNHQTAYEMLAKAIEDLKKDRATTVALDITLPYRTPYDKTFAKIVRKSGNVILGTQVGTFREGNEIFSVSYQPDNPVIFAQAPFGYINFDPDGDGILRSIQLYPSFSPFAILAALRYEKSFYGTVPHDYSSLAKGSKLLIRYFKNPVKIFSEEYSLLDLINGKLPPKNFSGKLVFIGYTDTSSQDVHNTPVGEEEEGQSFDMGIVIHALIAQDLLSGSFLKMASSPLQTISLLALLILISAVTSTSKNKRGALLGALVALSSLFYLYFFSEYLEHTKGILVNVAGFGFGIIACYTIVFIRRQVLVEGESALIHKAFTHYVGDQVLNELLEKQDLLAPQGTKKELTILFADIRGFTSISESTDPEIVVSQLREFFEIMGSVVLNCGGYINKFLGDGFLVLFGLSGAKDHAAQALNSAHLMLEALEKKNKKWKEEGKPFLNIGVGIHTGIVLWGNIGLKTRLEFTVIGDAVNVAARIQELTKDYSPIPILFSESTLEKISGEKKILLSKDFTFQELGEINVRGRKSAIKLYGTT